MRATGATKMSEMSSRSHAIFTIICEQVWKGQAGDVFYDYDGIGCLLSQNEGMNYKKPCQIGALVAPLLTK